MSIAMMKYLAWLLVWIACCGTAWGASPSDGKFVIRWNLKNMPDSVKGVLYDFNPHMSAAKAIAEFSLQDGLTVYEDTISRPRHLRFFGWGKGFPNWVLDLWVEPGGWIDFQGEDKWLNRWTVTTNVGLQKDMLGYEACVAAEVEEILRLDAETERGDSLSLKRLRELNNRIVSKGLSYLKTIPVTEAWLDKFLEIAWYATGQQDFLASCRPDFQQLYARLPLDWQNTERGKLMESYAFPAPTVDEGDEMVDGLLYDADGGKHHLSELKDRYILLDFWSVACGPCRMAEPELKEIAEIYVDKLALVGICTDDKERWTTFLTEHEMPGHQWNELKTGGRTLASRYKMSGIPYFVLIAPDGKILEIWKGYRKGILKKKLEKLVFALSSFSLIDRKLAKTLHLG